VVVGGPGTGKSTLARVVSATLGAEYVELDALWWQAGWVPSDPAEFVMKTRERLLDTERWIADGNYLDAVGSDGRRSGQPLTRLSGLTYRGPSPSGARFSEACAGSSRESGSGTATESS
jgi:hypothetical protein